MLIENNIFNTFFLWITLTFFITLPKSLQRTHSGSGSYTYLIAMSSMILPNRFCLTDLFSKHKIVDAELGVFLWIAKRKVPMAGLILYYLLLFLMTVPSIKCFLKTRRGLQLQNSS